MKKYFDSVYVFEPEVYSDHRGFFFQSFDEKISELLKEEFVQDNHSCSRKNVIRGLHYQWDQPMGKLIRVVRGRAIDYFVDIREGSPTYGQYDCVVLTAENHKMVWIPEGFAHGFVSLEDDTTVLYKCTAKYNKEGEAGINPFDPVLNIQWPIKSKEALMSYKDRKAQSFEEYSKNIKFNYRDKK
jgi:dTDP-4-dehydrorhamnose 3,5-epimerase